MNEVECFFCGIEKELVKLITSFDVVVGCIAWLTNEVIIEALEGKVVAIAVNEFRLEDAFSASLKAAYERLGLVDKFLFYPLPIIHTDYSKSPLCEAIRCIRNDVDQCSIMHNKFLVFCDINKKEVPMITPRAVWTGSYNMTRMANKNSENVVVIRTDHIVQAYYEEWSRLFALTRKIRWNEKPLIVFPPEWRGK